MKYIKLILLVLVLGFIFLFFYQNQAYLLTTYPFVLDLYFQQYTLPALATGFYIIFALLIGLVVMFVASLFPRFQTNREIRQLRQEQANIELLKKENTELLDNLCMLREQEKAVENSAAHPETLPDYGAQEEKEEEEKEPSETR